MLSVIEMARESKVTPYHIFHFDPIKAGKVKMFDSHSQHMNLASLKLHFPGVRQLNTFYMPSEITMYKNRLPEYVAR